jgi:hypothetical protein
LQFDPEERTTSAEEPPMATVQRIVHSSDCSKGLWRAFQMAVEPAKSNHA